VFQQENDPKHTTIRTKGLLRGKRWTVLNWPAMSHDLNETQWKPLERPEICHCKKDSCKLKGATEE